MSSEPVQQTAHPIYIFLDEGGNFAFNTNGTKYFTLTGLTTFRPFAWYNDLIDLKFELLEHPHLLNIEEFHAAEDHYRVRQRVFSILNKHHASFRVDSIIVQKNMAHPSIRGPEKFYPLILKCLLKYVIEGHRRKQISEAIFVTDALPAKNEKKKLLEKGIRQTLSHAFPEGSLTYRIMHWDSKAALGLQVVDYMNWAIYKKWSQGDSKPYDMIKASIRSEFEIFKNGTTRFY